MIFLNKESKMSSPFRSFTLGKGNKKHSTVGEKMRWKIIDKIDFMNEYV